MKDASEPDLERGRQRTPEAEAAMRARLREKMFEAYPIVPIEGLTINPATGGPDFSEVENTTLYEFHPQDIDIECDWAADDIQFFLTRPPVYTPDGRHLLSPQPNQPYVVLRCRGANINKFYTQMILLLVVLEVPAVIFQDAVTRSADYVLKTHDPKIRHYDVPLTDIAPSYKYPMPYFSVDRQMFMCDGAIVSDPNETRSRQFRINPEWHFPYGPIGPDWCPKIARSSTL